MAFDFDELEEQSSFKIPEIVPMSDAEFNQIRARMQAAVENGTYKDLDAMVAEALWGAKTSTHRASQIVDVLLDLLIKVAEILDEFGEDAAEERVLSGFAVMHVLFRFSLSLSQDEIVKHVGRGPGHPVVIILGSAGSHVRDLQIQAGYYRKQGFATLSMTRCLFPVALQRYQEFQFACELRQLLSRDDDPKLLVHLCGNHGHATWSNIVSLWGREEEPFSGLPSLKACLRGIVWECGPAGDDSLKAFEVEEPQASTEEPVAEAARGKPELSLQQAYYLQRDLYRNFSKSKFQDQLDKLEDKFDRGSSKFMAARNALFLEAQAPVLIKYGFAGNQRGVLEMLHVCSRFNKDELYAKNRDRLNKLLEINLVTASEHQRRLEAGYDEISASAKAKEPDAAPSVKSTSTTSNGNFKFDYEDDTTRMGNIIDYCVRSLVRQFLPNIDCSMLMQNNPEFRTLILGAARHGAFWLGNDYGQKSDSGESLWGKFTDWIAIDAAIQPPVPRLFLYSRKDDIIPDHAVERFIRAVEVYSPSAEIIVEKFSDADHMRLWKKSRTACEEAVATLLDKGGMLASKT